MTLTAVFLIMISTSFHAGWNLLSKSGKPSPLFFLILSLTSVMILTPFLCLNLKVLPAIPAKFWWLLVLTGFFETVYYTGLAQAYRHGDISLVYPLIRAIPVLLVPAVCFILKTGKPLSNEALTGMGLICVGCAMMPIKSFKSWHIRNYTDKALLWVVPGALGTVGYTIVDFEAIELLSVISFSVPGNIIYSSLINLSVIPWLIVTISILCRWQDAKEYRGKQITFPIMAGIACCLSYTLILASMNYVSNVSYITGFRQLSIPIGVLLGLIIFKERLYLPRIVGCALIVLGLLITALF